MIKNLVATLLCLLTGAGSTSNSVGPAREATYDCVVKQIYTLEHDGELRLSNYSAQAKGDHFVVSRTTGQIVGSWLTTAKATSAEALREGDDHDWSFQVLARFDVGPNHNAQVIEIRGWAEGPRKPFVAAAFGGAGIITGFCEDRS
jgi:hypothetical protein